MFSRLTPFERSFFSDFDRAFRAMDVLRRQLDAQGTARRAERGGDFPVSLRDEGDALVVEATLPGVTEDDLTIDLNRDVLTLSAQRVVQAPEGYSVHRQERPTLRLSRSFTLPVSVNPEATTATLKDGVLTVRLDKAPESKPRRIGVNGH